MQVQFTTAVHHHVRNVTLDIGPGEFAAVVGPSGSGKTSLLSLMTALDRPTSGTVRISGHAVNGLSDLELSGLRAFFLGIVFQQPSLSALDNVAAGLLYRGQPARVRRRRAAEALGSVGLSHRSRHHPGRLSGGERQRVAIARALIGESAALLLDEPTGNLDSAAAASIVGLLRDLYARGAAIVIITHDRDVAAAAHRTIEIRDGQLVADSKAVTA